MIIEPRIHFINSIEVEKIKSLGFQFSGISAFPGDFINTHFTNFDLFLFLEQINAVLFPLCNSVIHKLIKLDNTVYPQLSIQYLTENYEDENNGLALSRIFFWEKDELLVKHDFFRLPISARDKGIAKKIFRFSIQQYINMDIKKFSFMLL